MRRLSLLLIVSALFQSSIGCSKPSASSSEPGRPRPRPSDPIAQVVYDFWEAVRTGNVAQATALLTPVAQQRLSEDDYVFVPPASDTMSFQVNGVEIVEDDQAVVDSIWNDVDSDGAPYSEKMSLALRRVDGHWRIFGMAAEIGPNQPPVIMDLENPKDFFGPTEPATPANTAQAPRAAGETVRQASQPAEDPFRQ